MMRLERPLRPSPDPARPGKATPAPAVEEVLNSPAHSLSSVQRSTMSEMLGLDFSHVRIHVGGQAASVAAAVQARALTVGQHIILGEKQWQPGTIAGQQLLAHELVHVAQQASLAHNTDANQLEVSRPDDPAEREADQVTESISAGGPTPVVRRSGVRAIHRQLASPYSGRVRSPVIEEAITQETEVMSGVQSTRLTPTEIQLARSVFGDSIDYSRVRLVQAPEALWFRTVGNVIRVPSFFTVDSSAAAGSSPLPIEYMRHTFIHEMTHVWQYQHGGTRYVSYSLGPQIAAISAAVAKGISAAARGTPARQAFSGVPSARNSAYIYIADPRKSFWDFTPEQQGLIVENFFLMRESGRALLAGPDGELTMVSDQAVIGPLIPVHQHYIDQLRNSLPAPEAEILLQRATEDPTAAAPDPAAIPAERRLTPIKPILEIRFL